MLTFVTQKLLHKKWMILSLLIGNILLISITCCNPMYQAAALQKMLTSNLNSYLTNTNKYPGAVKASVAYQKDGDNEITAPVFMDASSMSDKIRAMVNTPVLQEITFYATKIREMTPEVVRENDKTDKKASIGFLSDIENHISIIAGDMYNRTVDEDGVIDCIISQKILIQLNLLVDEVMIVDELVDLNGNPLKIRIAGVFEASDLSDAYWSTTPSAYGKVLFIDEDLFVQNVYQVPGNEMIYTAQATILFDYLQMTTGQVNGLVRAGDELLEQASGKGTMSCMVNFLDTLKEYQVRAKNVAITMWILQVPIFILLAAFIYMVSRQMLEMEQNEIAMMKSRGVSKKQIVTVYVLQSTILSFISYLIGLPLAYLICKVLGATNAFMEFVGRKSLELNITPQVLLYGLIAALFSVLVMTIPSIKHAGVTIIEHKQRLRRKSTPLWQRVFLDVILLAVSLYEYYNFSQQADLIAQKVSEGAALDPVIFLNSSLFVFSAGLVSLRIIPAITWMIYTIFKRFWKPSVYASFLHIIRTKRKQGFICVFMILTIAIGIFNAGIARTVNKNVEDSILYEVGADIVLKEKWPDNSLERATNPDLEMIFREPDYWKYESLEGIESVTKVYRDNYVQLSVNATKLKNIELLAIDTKEFGETAWMKDNVLDEHFFYYLNLISQNSKAILVSQNFADNFDIKVGDVLNYTGVYGDSASGTVYGFIDAWPTYSSKTTAKGTDGVVTEVDQYLIVAHFAQVQSSFGMVPYEVWIKTEGSSQFIYDFIEENHITTVKFKDTKALLVEAHNNAVYQVTNGLLTINFIVTLTLCAVGFLIYWILSIKSRELLFGVYRAMGMSMKEILAMLVNEHIYISFLSIGFGILIGIIASKLFIPQIEIAYRVSNQTLPIEIASSGLDMIRLSVIITGMLVFCITILGILISKIKISQALKLGEE